MNDIKVHPLDLNFLGQQHGIASFLVEAADGPLLVECGPHSTLPALEKGLASHGYQLSDIQHVLLTHIHLDHAGAAWCLAERGAQIYLHPLGYKHMHDPSRLLASAKMIYREAMDMLWGTLQAIPAEQLTIVEHGESVSIAGIDCIAWHTPGHAKHHIAWQLGADLFTGDVGGVCINGGPVIPPCPPPDIDIEAWTASIELIESLEEVERYHLTHFGQVDDLQRHMGLLRESIAAYAGFFRPLYEQGRTVEEVLPDFREFVRGYLVHHGMSPTDADAYEAANPSDMSATGLLRYWSKRLG